MSRSRICLPRLDPPPKTVLEHLISHFSQIPASAWKDRMARGLVTCEDGSRLGEDTPYRHGITVFYRKEVPSEPEPLEVETILYQDEEILVADKPHGMPVTPSGNHVARALLNRLQERTGIENLVPLHRLDRDTAGLVMFGIKRESRARYHELFAKGAVEREYFAAAAVPHVPPQTRWVVENRLGEGTPWFRRQIVPGPVNAVTEIELLETRDGIGTFRMMPRTGKKHQLRLHMASLGYPILGDPLYPVMHERQPADPPLQLLARGLRFTDPWSGKVKEFTTSQAIWGSDYSNPQF